MTQIAHFLEFLRARAESGVSQAEVLVRLAHDQLVITARYPLANSADLRSIITTPVTDDIQWRR